MSEHDEGGGGSRLCDDDRVWALALGALGEAETAETDAHIAGCSRCRRRREAVAADLEVVRRFDGGDGPPDEVARTLLERARAAGRRGRRLRVGAIVVILVAALTGGIWFAWRVTENRLAKRELRDLEHAIVRWQDGSGRYPADGLELGRILDELGEAAAGIRRDRDGRPIDRWGRPIRYRFPGERVPGLFDLWSAGLDGVDDPDGLDDIANWR